jgi:hypothetical protein
MKKILKNRLTQIILILSSFNQRILLFKIISNKQKIKKLIWVFKNIVIALKIKMLIKQINLYKWIRRIK